MLDEILMHYNFSCGSLLQDVLLCGVYAKREAFYGNIDHSRKIFDMALSSIEVLPLVCIVFNMTRVGPEQQAL